MSSADHYTVYRGDASILWSATVKDASGAAGGTAFDFRGDGSAEAMYTQTRPTCSCSAAPARCS